jgi:hypothetical protein
MVISLKCCIIECLCLHIIYIIEVFTCIMFTCEGSRRLLLSSVEGTLSAIIPNELITVLSRLMSYTSWCSSMQRTGIQLVKIIKKNIRFCGACYVIVTSNVTKLGLRFTSSSLLFCGFACFRHFRFRDTSNFFTGCKHDRTSMIPHHFALDGQPIRCSAWKIAA